jgi:hypothetical protein
VGLGAGWSPLLVWSEPPGDRLKLAAAGQCCLITGPPALRGAAQLKSPLGGRAARSPARRLPLCRKLKALAKRLTEEASWDTLYCVRLYRTGKGASGLLFRSFPGPWLVYSTADSTADYLGACVGEFEAQPDDAVVRRLLEGGRAAVDALYPEQAEEARRRAGRFW